MKTDPNSQGLGLPLMLLIIAIALAGAGSAYYSIQKNAAEEQMLLEKNAMELDAERLREAAENMDGSMMNADEPMHERPAGSMEKAMETGQQTPNEETMMEKKETAVKTQIFNITGRPFAFNPQEIRIEKGTRVRINFTNEQGMHDWVIDEFNTRTKVIQTGQTDSVEFIADKTGTFEYYCSVGNHRASGMVGRLIVQ